MDLLAYSQPVVGLDDLTTYYLLHHHDFGLEESAGEVVDGKQPPLIDQVYQLMHLWRAGDVAKVDAYPDDHGLRHEVMFHQLLQALIELAPAGSEERSLLESISNHVSARGEAPERKPGLFNKDLFGQKEES